MLNDCHIHSSFSGDSKEPAANHARRAMELGMTEICFTDHEDHGNDCSPIFALDIESYFSGIASVREEYAGRINILTGIELGLQKRAEEHNLRLSEYPFDYIIASNHYFNGLDPYYPSYWSGEKHSMLEDIFCQTLSRIRSFDRFDALGHLDYPVRYSPGKDSDYFWTDYRDVIEEILRLIISRGQALECNTGSFRCGLHETNPCSGIFRRYRELGGELITIGSDAHSIDYLGLNFDSAAEMLSSIGFKYYFIYHGRVPAAYPLIP